MQKWSQKDTTGSSEMAAIWSLQMEPNGCKNEHQNGSNMELKNGDKTVQTSALRLSKYGDHKWSQKDAKVSSEMAAVWSLQMEPNRCKNEHHNGSNMEPKNGAKTVQKSALKLSK